MVVGQEYQAGKDLAHAVQSLTQEGEGRLLQLQELPGRRGLHQCHLGVVSRVQVEPEPRREQAVAAIGQAWDEAAEFLEQELVRTMAIKWHGGVLGTQR